MNVVAVDIGGTFTDLVGYVDGEIVSSNGVARIADTSMSLSVRAVSINKGVDPRDTAMIAFGGVGPLHAVSIEREIHIPTVIIPKLPGTFSALGMLMASWRQDFVQTLIGRVGELSEAEIERVFADLTSAGKEQLLRDEIEAGTEQFQYSADLRYVGQEHAISIPIENIAMLMGEASEIRGRFNCEHDRRYSQSAPDESLEIVSLRLVLTAERSSSAIDEWLSRPWVAEPEVPVTTRDVIFNDSTDALPAKIYWRPSMPAGMSLVGPAVIEEPDSTILVHPGDEVVVTDAGHLMITLAQHS